MDNRKTHAHKKLNISMIGWRYQEEGRYMEMDGNCLME